jgi:hypothetical protein
MDKQINLYANIFASQQRRRRNQVIVSIFIFTLCAALYWILVQQQRSRDALQVKIDLVSDAQVRESNLLDSLKKEVRSRQSVVDTGKRDEWAVDSNRFIQEAAQPEMVSSVWLSFKNWRSPGAALTKVGLDVGTLTLTGDARGAREATIALDGLMQEVIKAGVWDLVRHEIKAPVGNSPYYEFTLTAMMKGRK